MSNRKGDKARIAKLASQPRPAPRPEEDIAAYENTARRVAKKLETTPKYHFLLEATVEPMGDKPPYFRVVAKAASTDAERLKLLPAVMEKIPIRGIVSWRDRDQEEPSFEDMSSASRRRMPAEGGSDAVSDAVSVVEEVSSELLQYLREVSLAYVNVIVDCASHLPERAREEIRLYITEKTQDKVAAVLSDVLRNAKNKDYNLRPPSVDESADPAEKHRYLCALYRAQLTQQYIDIAARRWTSKTDERDALMRFCQMMMGTPDLRHDIEPMTAYLITCAANEIDAESNRAYTPPGVARWGV